MNVVVAEDEYLERKVLKKFLEDSFPNIHVVGEAPNGRVAIEMARNEDVDFMIVDIKMPGIDGLQAIEAIRKEKPHMKFIIMSAYNYFDYAKKAMKMGVKEYILKPSKKEELVEAIHRMKKEIEEERKMEVESNHIKKQQFLYKLLHNEIDDQVKQMQKELFPGTHYIVCMAIDRVEKENLSNWEQWLAKSLAVPSLFTFQNGQLIIFLFTEQELKRQQLQEVAKSMYHRAPDVVVGIGCSYHYLKDALKSYNEAVLATQQLKSRNQSYGFYRKQHKSEDCKKAFFSALQLGDEQRAMLEMKNCLNKLDEDDVREIFFHMKHNVEGLQQLLDDFKFQNILDEAEWEKLVRLCTTHIQHVQKSQRYIERVQQYIKENYHHSMTLEDAAALVDLSPSYLSVLFKEETNQTFIEYVTHIRMERAIELLQQNKHSLKEICFMIGYKDPNYFSRVFKKHTSKSPKQFQGEILKK
ncbi:response regulator [Salirhabdus salicampi]|uniref:response regulator n=1 Tax=Salirhabdus salicampi TaxID=476102 RepID=UPI0020C232D0|nr:response regulator [Salirhabdus salicampi]MCP8617561.1 response regulator [Salirhabdus salicampi]